MTEVCSSGLADVLLSPRLFIAFKFQEFKFVFFTEKIDQYVDDDNYNNDSNWRV